MGHYMDKHLIIEFPTQAESEQGLSIINMIAAAYWQSQGYTVIDGQLIGKNAATGLDMPDSAKTITWDEVKKSPDNTFYFTSPRIDEKFIAWRELLPDGVTMPSDKIFPIEWMPVSE